MGGELEEEGGGGITVVNGCIVGDKYLSFITVLD